jgi:hypothetical protein
MTGWLITCSALVVVVTGLVAAYVLIIRPWHLCWGATDEEARAPLPGDDLVDRPKGQATHAVTVGAPAAEVWPWLVQLGQDRAGFYSYTPLENLFGCHMRNTYQIVPEWQHLEAGDGVLFHPKFPRVPVAVLEPNRALVLGGLLDARTGSPVEGDGADADTCLATSWAFVLRYQGEGRTRLIARSRTRWPRGLKGWLANRLFWEPAHFIMEWKMLRTIKRLAEAEGSAEGRLARRYGRAGGDPGPAANPGVRVPSWASWRGPPAALPRHRDEGAFTTVGDGSHEQPCQGPDRAHRQPPDHGPRVPGAASGGRRRPPAGL